MALQQDNWVRFAAEADRLGLIHRCAGELASVQDLLQAEPPPHGATHVLLLLQAGGAYWEQLQSLRRLDPNLDRHPDPLDTMTMRLSLRLRELLGGACLEARFPFASKLDFVSLGERLGAGRRSRLSILLHPEYGSWIAFRMLFFIDDKGSVLPHSAPLAAHPCDDCAGHCRQACPAGAFTGAPGRETLEYLASFQYRNVHRDVCATGCAARLACPAGQAYRYPADFVEAAHRRAFAVGTAFLDAEKNSAKPAGTVPPAQGSLF